MGLQEVIEFEKAQMSAEQEKIAQATVVLIMAAEGLIDIRQLLGPNIPPRQDAVIRYLAKTQSFDSVVSTVKIEADKIPVRLLPFRPILEAHGVILPPSVSEMPPSTVSNDILQMRRRFVRAGLQRLNEIPEAPPEPSPREKIIAFLKTL